MDGSDVANLLLSGTALVISGVALLIARKQVVLDERSLRLAERESSVAEQERAARSALIVETEWQPSGGVSRASSVNAPFVVTIAIRNDGARDATDVAVALLVPETIRSAGLHLGQALPQLEVRNVEGVATRFRRHELMLERVRRVPQEVVGNVEFWRGNEWPSEPITAPVVIEVRCADQPEGHETQAWEHTLRWIVPRRA